MKITGLLLVAAVLGAASPAAAQGLAGSWTFSGDTQDTAGCKVTLGVKTVPGGRALTAPAACRKVFAGAARFAVWRTSPGGGVVFANASGRALLEFGPVADGDFLAQLDNGNGYVLTRSPGRRR